jgi:DNA-binding MurR/RpiR family transcriptional regulator
MQEDVFEKIGNSYYRLTTAEKKVADYVLLHPEETQFLSISELAEGCGVAESTITRFCRKLHYTGYGSFKIALATARTPISSPRLTGQIQPGDSMDELLQKVHTAHSDTLDQAARLLSPGAVIQAVDLFCASDKVLCMGQGGSMLMAAETAHLFSTVSGKFIAVEDSHRQAVATALLGPEDTILFFSYSGATKDLMDTLSLARARGCRVVLVTHFPKSPGASLADVVLQCAANESPLQLGSVCAKVAQLFIADALYHEFCRRDPATSAQHRAQVAEALACKHI